MKADALLKVCQSQLPSKSIIWFLLLCKETAERQTETAGEEGEDD